MRQILYRAVRDIQRRGLMAWQISLRVERSQMSDCEIHATGSPYQATTDKSLHSDRSGNATNNTQTAMTCHRATLTHSPLRIGWAAPAMT